MKDLESYVSGPAQDLLNAAGEDVTLVTRDVATDANGDPIYDEYGDPEYTETRIDTVAEIVTRGSVAFERRLDGIDGDVTAVAWIPKGHDISTGSESDATGPTRLESATHTFSVYDWFDEHNGKHRLHLAE